MVPPAEELDPRGGACLLLGAGFFPAGSDLNEVKVLLDGPYGTVRNCAVESCTDAVLVFNYPSGTGRGRRLTVRTPGGGLELVAAYHGEGMPRIEMSMEQLQAEFRGQIIASLLPS